MSVAVFDYDQWILRYPEFSSVTQPRAQLFFDEACVYFDNTDSSPITNIPRRLTLLNMLTAHVAQLAGARNPDGVPDGTIGAVSSATEGSASVSYDSGLLPGTAIWYRQTPYGLAFWQATINLRSAFCVAAPRRVIDPWQADTFGSGAYG